MTNRSVEMHELRVPIESVKALSDEERYTYYLLGHMFNELMCLQKLVGYSIPKHDDRRPARFHPEFGQSLFLFRLATSKVWEAIKKLRSKEVSNVLKTRILPSMTHGTQRLKELNATVDSASWLIAFRNGIGFHFPSLKQWENFVKPQSDWVDDSIFLGSETGNTFYDGSESIAQHWMLHQMDSTDDLNKADALIHQMIDLLKVMNSFLEDALGTLIVESLLKTEVPRAVGKVSCPEFGNFHLPFWTFMRPHPTLSSTSSDSGE